MKLISVFCLLALFEGHDCETFFVNGETSACLYQKTGKPPFTQFIQKSVDNDLLFDYDFGRSSLYYFSSPEQPSHGNMSRLVTCQHMEPVGYCPNVTSLPMYYEVVDIALDWVYYSLYVIDNGGRKLHINQLPKPGETSETEDTRKSIAVEDIARGSGVRASLMYLRGLQVDPYNKFLFLQLSIANHSDSSRYAPNNSDLIIRTDLSAEGPQQIPGNIFSNEMMFYVDIGYLRIYILEKGALHVYDYDGRKLNYTSSSSYFGSFASHFSVFRNKTYLYRYTGIANFIVTVDLTELTQDSVYSLYGDKYEPMLFDARTKRRMINGSYICDRKDCEDLCSVLPSGETCACYKPRQQAVDGISCYDCGQANFTTAPNNTSGVTQVSSVYIPWIAEILYQFDENGWITIAGGTLITPRVVLTRDSGISFRFKRESATRWAVALGNISASWDVINPNEIRLHFVKYILVYPEYEEYFGYIFQNIALVILENEVKINEFVMPACVDYSQNLLPPFNALTTYAVYLNDVNNERNSIYNYKTTKVLNYTDCLKISKDVPRPTPLMLDEFCIEKNFPTHFGSTGYGLVVAYNGVHYLVGVLRYDKPSVTTYSNISLHMDWLKDALKNN